MRARVFQSFDDGRVRALPEADFVGERRCKSERTRIGERGGGREPFQGVSECHLRLRSLLLIKVLMVRGCFWRLMMISPSFERTARRVLSSLCFFVFVLEKGQPKKKEHLSLISLFFLGPLLFYYVTFTSREREREM